MIVHLGYLQLAYIPSEENIVCATPRQSSIKSKHYAVSIVISTAKNFRRVLCHFGTRMIRLPQTQDAHGRSPISSP
jgi:hypothetical protein